MLPHQERVIIEKKELDEKITKLKSFFVGETFRILAFEDQELLDTQLGIMEEYSEVLKKRIERFN